MSKVLITGAAGFIASRLSYKLYKENNEVVLIDNFSYGHEDNLIFPDIDFRSKIHRKDIRDIDFLTKLFSTEKFDIIYHYAGLTPLPDCQNNPIDAVDINIKGTVILLDLARKFGVKKFIFASTSAVYENNKDFPSREEKVDLPSLFYPSTKYACETLLKSYNDSYNIPIVIFRFANVYGPHMDCLRTKPPVVAYIIRELFYDRSPIIHSKGTQERDFIYIDDLVDLSILVGRSSKNFDIVNVSSGKTISINKIVEIIKEKMKKTHIETKYENTDHYWIDYKELYEGVYPINMKLLEKEVLKYTCLSNIHAYNEYKWKPSVSIEEGLQRTIDYTVRLLSKDNKK